MRPIRVTPRTQEQIIEGFCVAEDIEASINCLDLAEQAIIKASFCPQLIVRNEVSVELAGHEDY